MMTPPPAQMPPRHKLNHACVACRDGEGPRMAFTMAFQPIVDVQTGRVFAHEALVRGLAGEPAGVVLGQVGPDAVYRFDQDCRLKAITLAGQRFAPDDDAKLSINFMPNAVYEPRACIRASLSAARRVGFDPSRLMFEFTENEPMRDVGHVRRIVSAYRALGFTTAIDDFGSGYAGLTLLADLRPDIIKIDMALVRGVDGSAARRAIIASLVRAAEELDVRCIAEGVETAAELATLRQLGLRLCQGFLLGRPRTLAPPPSEAADPPVAVPA